MEAPFDRGEVDRASLDATERLRARLSGRPIQPPQPRQRSVLPWVIAGSLFVFSAGMIANPWFESNVRRKLPFAEANAPVAAPATPEVKLLSERLQLLESRAGAPATTMPAERLARTEARIETSTDQIARDAARIDKLSADVAGLTATIAAYQARSETATTMATTAAERAQAMLTLVLVRRAVDSGRVLGPLDGALRQAFETRYPQAVQSVAAIGAAPVTLATLRRDFNNLRPGIGARPPAGARQDWWQTLRSTVMDVVTRPAADAPLAPPEAAAAALQRGDVATAAAQLRRLPGPLAPGVTNWLAAADRLLAADAGLAVLETATILPAPVVVAAKP